MRLIKLNKAIFSKILNFYGINMLEYKYLYMVGVKNENGDWFRQSREKV